MADGNEQYAAECGNGIPAVERSVVGSAVSRALAEVDSILSGVELDRERLVRRLPGDRSIRRDSRMQSRGRALATSQWRRSGG